MASKRLSVRMTAVPARFKDRELYCRFRRTARRIPTLLFILLGAHAVFGQAPVVAQGPGGYADTIFDQLNHKNGLSGSVAQAIAQDSDGFLWVGTEMGLSRWDGYNVRSYVTQPGTTGSLPSNNVMTLYLDPQGRLWVGTNHGLSRYDAARDRFDTFTPSGPTGDYPSIYAIVTDGRGGLWLATRKGLDHFDPNTGRFQPELMAGNQTGRNTPTLIRDPDGRLWAGTTRGLFVSDGAGHHFQPVAVVEGKPPTVWSLLRDRAGRLWIGTTAGMYVLEPGAAMPRPLHESDPASPLDRQGIDALVEVEPGVLWLGTYGEGIVEVDTKSWQTHRILHQPSIPTSLAHNLVDVFFRDRAGATWAGSVGGLSRRNPTGQGILTFFGGTGDAAHPIAESDITAVSVMPDGRLWLGLLEKGIQVFDASGRELSEPISAASLLKMQNVASFAPAPDGSMYFGSEQGLYHADRDGRHIRHIDLKENNLKVTQVAYDPAGLWLGTPAGLWRLPLPLAAGTQMSVQVKSLPAGPITALLRGQGSDLWAGLGNNVYRIDAGTLATERAALEPGRSTPLPAAVMSLMADRAGRVWITTDGAGLYQVQDRVAQGQLQIRKITTLDAGRTLEAADGGIWFPGGDSLARLDPHTLAVQSFKQPDGVAIPGYWADSGAAGPDGRLYFGGVGGLTIVDPRRTRQWAYAAPVAVSQVSVGDKPAVGARQLANSGAAPILIPADANRLAVEFSALDFSAPDRNRYAYRLVGFDRDWVEADTGSRIARYTNLPPGGYTLELRGSNRMGDWGATRAVEIRVLPAWYQTLWARLLAVLAAILAVVFILRIYTALLRAGQRELKRKVAVRTGELESLTVKLQQSQQELEFIAHQDSLTGLPNRRMFTACFRQLLEGKRQQGGAFTLLLLDLDKFKSINDSFGHDAGDALLQTVAERLRALAGQNDCFARLGGDEFAFLLADIGDDTAAAQTCRRIVAALEDPMLLPGLTLQTTLSMGMAVYPNDGRDQESLYKAADLALYEVKRGGRNGWRRYMAEQSAPLGEAAGSGMR
ncbi:diguanylate cyclase (GGDEF) domain-containing protein [Granulicella rosea]|uniref:Diguanylate cyclase (GGDEF) domain-containing protein n=1 Tax=Granulicella rosea TaxID=474952 RepID=A0A239D4X9_9BACT|nr:ligand-binding sensor domain-containing diguanylate cyclase [Granulicella rosea]SNS26911.1 diguanylate cyclase (GGDEF) domain-containing protein [Granulicella rosea]